MTSAAAKQTVVSTDGVAESRPELDTLLARATNAEGIAANQALLVEMFAELLSGGSLAGALDALAGAMQTRFDCERVAIALEDNGELELSAISQQAVLAASSSEARLLLDAMNEACSLESIVSWPPSSDELGVLVAHRSLAGRRRSGSLCTVPLYNKQQLVGVVLLERRDQQTFPLETFEILSASIAPLLLLHKKADRNWWSVFKLSVHTRLARYLGPERPGMRALCILAAVLFLGSFIVTTRWQIVAPAELLSFERRLITAPQAGFIAQMQVAAGDQVSEGQLLGRLDPRELELEAASRESEVVVAEAEFRAAIASNDRQSTGIARARLVQARARHESIKQRLDRTDLVSPINGLVVAADATRTTGTAVSRGETLFEIAPGTDFEVHVLVDEVDVYDVVTGQTGTLSLKAMPGETIPIVVDSVYPVAEANGGENRFRVKANLTAPATSLRPGQSGVVRLDAGRTSIIGALTRKLNRRLAELWWRWVG
jgi:multidrug efflux pump subunit AcrA (membrane-fusion protein)